MIQGLLQHGMTFLVQDMPGPIVGPISRVLGSIINFFMNILPDANALGFAIIIMTVLVRLAMTPNTITMMKNAIKTRAMKPEMDKIKAKYGNTRDPELRRKMSVEMQELNRRYGVNMLATCLPMLIMWPLFAALFAVLGRAFMFIDNIGETYSYLSNALISLGPDFLIDVVNPIAYPYAQGMGLNFVTEDLNRVIHVFTPADWDAIFRGVYDTFGEAAYANIRGLYDAKVSVVSFFGLDLVEAPGFRWPQFIVPLLSAGTGFLSQWLMMKSNAMSMEPSAAKMQKIQLVIFPLLFGWLTVTAAAGVGLYWTMGSVAHIGQHFLIKKYLDKKGVDIKPKDSKA